MRTAPAETLEDNTSPRNAYCSLFLDSITEEGVSEGAAHLRWLSADNNQQLD